MQIAAMAGCMNVQKQGIQCVGNGASVASADATESQDAAAKRCATNLMEKFGTMGTKARGKID